MGHVVKDLFVRTFTAALGGASVSLGCAASGPGAEPGARPGSSGADASPPAASPLSGEAEAATPTDDAADASVVPCGDPPGAPALDYNLAADGARFHVDVVREGDEWAPARPVKMPFHHASRIEWTNAAEHPELATLRRPLRFEITIVGRSIVHDPARNTWFATYTARIDRICGR